MHTRLFLSASLVLSLTTVLRSQIASASPPLVAASSATVPKDEAVALEKFLVVGQPVENYRATDALTGTKTGALLRDLPLSLAVVPRQLIEDRRLTFLGEALDSVSGAQRKLGYGGTQNFGAFIRGFDSGFVTLRNGFRDFGFNTLRDTANVERFEVLKGPASVLYGTLQPGGITNTLSKQPLARPLARATIVAGDFDFYRAELDAGGPLTPRTFYRANLAYENAGSFRAHVENRSEFVAPAMTWLIGERTRWTVELEYKHSDYTWDLALPRNPLSFTVPISRFLGEPSAKNDISSVLISSSLEHRVNERWRLRQNAQFAYSGGDYNLRSPLGIGADGRTVSRVAYNTQEYSHNYNLQHELVGQLDAFGFGHQAIAGVEAYRNQQVYDFLFQPLASIDLFAPVYGAQPGAGFPLFGNDIKADALGLYVQDLTRVRENVKLLAGVRYDTVYIDNYDRLGKKTARRSTESAFSPQVGLVFQPTIATSLYASFSRSFSPVTSGTTKSGAYLQPEEGEQFEVGAKQELFGGKASATLAAYWITKQNVSTADLANPPFRIQTGEQQSEGLELDLTGTLLPGWDVILTGAYNDAVVSRDNTIPVGSILPAAPRLSGSVWSKYTFRTGEAQGFSIGVGATSAAKRKAAIPNPVWWLPSYTRFDGMIAYARDRWSVQLNVKNLSNERIYDLTGTTIMPQQPRAFLFSAAYRF